MRVQAPHRFNTSEEAALTIKIAAGLFGALRCGITKVNKRLQYEHKYGFNKKSELTGSKLLAGV